MDGDMEVSVLEVYGSRPISRADCLTNFLHRFYLEVGGVQITRVEPLEVEDGPHPSTLLRNQEEAAYKAQRWRVEGDLLDGSLAEKGLHFPVYEVVSIPLGRGGEVGLGIRKRRRGGKGGR